MAQYFLSDADRDKIKAALDRLDQTTQNHINSYQPDVNMKSADTYFGLLPCDATIPARRGQDAGAYDVCLYKNTHQGNGVYKIDPVKYPDDSIVRVTCYNIYSEAVTSADGYFQMTRSKYGRWLNERPTGNQTTTTAGPTADYPTPCSGTCEWRWNNYTKIWEIQVDGCTLTGTPSTTTPIPTGCYECPDTYQNSATTISPSSTTTTTTTSSPTSTTTTDPNLCNCIYPPYCGTVDGETYSSGCSSIPNNPQIDCTTTTTVDPTTTTCDCNTTTTILGCDTGCEWEVDIAPDQGGLLRWKQTSNGCTIGLCDCAIPSEDPNAAGCGATTSTECITITGPAIPPPPSTCSGECDFMWNGTQWVRITWTCSPYCFCETPSYDGSNVCDVPHVIRQQHQLQPLLQAQQQLVIRVLARVPMTPTQIQTVGKASVFIFTMNLVQHGHYRKIIAEQIVHVLISIILELVKMDGFAPFNALRLQRRQQQ